ncbi:MAG: HAD family phosphatase [Schwartzia sp.]|nr:HAD family phosphatase [Schwartzia sp. (in: firmicutes)]
MSDKIKLIFCDMDGTLLDENGNLPPDFDEVIGEVLRRGAIFAPASGRQYSALTLQMEKYADDFIFISENGTFAARHDKELFSSEMKTSDVLHILKEGKRIPGAYPVLCGKRIAYVGEEFRPFLREMERYFTQNRIVPDLEATAAAEPLIKIAYCDAEQGDAERTIYPGLKKLDGPVHVALSSNYWVDIMNPGMNKGFAVQKLQELLNVPPEACAAFGDYLNDLEMLRNVKFSFAMENAHPALFEAAAYRAPANTACGVTKKLRELLDEGMI